MLPKIKNQVLKIVKMIKFLTVLFFRFLGIYFSMHLHFFNPKKAGLLSVLDFEIIF